jgi:hypothetical protein
MSNRVPAKLFKFTSWAPILKQEGERYVLKEATKEALEAGYLFFSPPDGFDDPQDIHADKGVETPESKVDSRQHMAFPTASQCGNGMTESQTDQEWKGVVEAEHKHSRMYCLAENWNNELMWALYGEDHRGICLAFDGHHAFFKNAKPILYSDAPREPLAYSKSKAWAFQEEWRLVLPGPEPQQIPFPKESLKEIYLGYRFRESEIEELKHVLTRGGYSADIFQVRRIPHTFGFDAVKIEEVHPKDELLLQQR